MKRGSKYLHQRHGKTTVSFFLRRSKIYGSLRANPWYLHYAPPDQQRAYPLMNAIGLPLSKHPASLNYFPVELRRIALRSRMRKQFDEEGHPTKQKPIRIQTRASLSSAKADKNSFRATLIPSLKKNSGFTLMEAIVVIIILGTIAALAIPNYQSAVETVRSREGVNTLTALLNAQQRYGLENGGVFTNALGNLDITIPGSTSFNAPTVAAAVNPGDIAASVQRTGGTYGTYTLSITRGGTVSCAGGSGGICGKIGY